MDGYLLIDKPAGWTSFDVVNYIRRMVEQHGLGSSNRKRFPAGHTGTLDPLATGLMVVVLGAYTKRAMELTKLNKTYEVVMRLGSTSTTGDGEGELTGVSGLQPGRQAIDNALTAHTGELLQTPPAYSAMKVDGVRAYKLARAGKAVQLAARPVRVNAITAVSYHYPEVRFTADVSSGTYIRSLVEDIGKRLGTGAYMSGLRRTVVGPFDIADACHVTELTPEALQARLAVL